MWRLAAGHLLSLLESWYRFFEKVHYRYYDEWNPRAVKKVAARVISVGNITWGGTGKTPLVITLALELAGRGKRVCVLTRGYGNDESFQLTRALKDIPVLVGRDRVRTAQEALQKHHPQIIILDDGFQHLRLHRDLDIVAINATNPFGNFSLIPRGVLREPMDRLSRAHVFVLTQTSLGKRNLVWIRQRLRGVNPGAPIFEADHRPIYLTDLETGRRFPLAYLKDKAVAALSGIEDPFSFERTIAFLGAGVKYAARFGDHHPFTPRDLSEVLKASQEMGLRYIITTEKDSYRLERVLNKVGPHQVNFLVLHVELRVDDEGLVSRCEGEGHAVEQAPA